MKLLIHLLLLAFFSEFCYFAAANEGAQEVPDYAHFFSAARAGDVDQVRAVLAKGLDPMILDSRGNSALIIASGRGRVEVINELIKAGAPPEDTSSQGLLQGKTCLMWAASQGRLNASKQIKRVFLEQFTIKPIVQHPVLGTVRRAVILMLFCRFVQSVVDSSEDLVG